MILLIISFVAGVLTVLAPCILPLLPVIVGGSISEGGNKMRKAFTITLALGASVILFTLFLKATTLLIDIPPYVWNIISGGLILALGIITLFPSIWSKFKINSLVNRSSNRALARGHGQKSFKGDILTGFALGPVFTTCSPTFFVLLATVLPSTPLLGFIYLLVFVFGLMLSLLIISFVGQKIMGSLNVATNPDGWFKKTLGVLFILVAIFIFTGLDKKLEERLISENSFFLIEFEQNLLERYNR